ncbi:MAG: SpoIIE family protein phosphatase [Spirochaetales bacterium]|nr:SpoIIE family protein phosphatase [Leptospiraceae bacterium]MCP5482354.1 SpoIIE family protein phosphatase [Spirochaetales bacterium]MCP5484207.1 SpoIIE family protein phosphatase [Spirochaetales bacterium]
MFRDKADLWLILPVSVALSALTGFWVFWFGAPVFDNLMRDQIHRQVARRDLGIQAGPDIVYVTVNDDTYEHFHESYLNRRRLAEVNRVLAGLDVRAIAYDMIFARPAAPEEDRDFADSLREDADVYLPVAYELEEEPVGFPRALRTFASLERFQEHARGSGHVSAPADDDGIFRHLFLFVRDGDALVPALPLRVYLDLRSLTLADLDVKPGRFVRFPASDGQPQLRIPIDAQGRVYIPYVHRWKRDFAKVPLHSLLELATDEFMHGNLVDQFEGRVVLVGDVATGIADMGATPLENDVPLVAIHAALLNAMLTNSFYRPRSVVYMVILHICLTGLLAIAASLRRLHFIYIVGPVLLVLIPIYTALEFIYAQRLVPGGSLFFSVGAMHLSLLGLIQYRLGQEKRRADRENERFRHELHIAYEIQQGIIPQTLPSIPGMDTAALSMPARTVGGDFYDVLPFGERFVFVLGDVTGKGVPAALYMSGVATSFRAILRASDPHGEGALLKAVLTLNDVLLLQSRATERSYFVTVCFVLCDPRTGDLEILRSGHEPPLLIHSSGQVDEFGPPGFVLGVLDSERIAKMTRLEPAHLEEGDSLVLYSDGVTEASTPERELFGRDRLKALLATAAELRPDAVLKEIIQAAGAFSAGGPETDDLTVLVLQRCSPAR